MRTKALGCPNGSDLRLRGNTGLKPGKNGVLLVVREPLDRKF